MEASAARPEPKMAALLARTFCYQGIAKRGVDMKNDLRTTMIGAAVILPLFGFSHAVADTFTISDDVTLTDPVQTGRLTRNGVASVAGTLKPFPGINDFLPHHFDAYTFVNTTGSLQTVAVTLETTDLADFSATYAFSFDPANIAINYLADAGGMPQILLK